MMKTFEIVIIFASYYVNCALNSTTSSNTTTEWGNITSGFLKFPLLDELCKSVVCPQADCEKPMKLAGTCCPLCIGTNLDLQKYLDNFSNSTKTFENQLNNILSLDNSCKDKICNTVTCDHPVKLIGSCCPICPLKSAQDLLEEFSKNLKKECDSTTSNCVSILSTGAGAAISDIMDTVRNRRKISEYEDCSAVACTMIACEQPYLPKGQCCPICLESLTEEELSKIFKRRPKLFPQRSASVDCSAIICPTPKCESPVKKEGECCERCDYASIPFVPLDCSTIKCGAVQCDNPIHLIGSCCPFCEEVATIKNASEASTRSLRKIKTN